MAAQIDLKAPHQNPNHLPSLSLIHHIYTVHSTPLHSSEPKLNLSQTTSKPEPIMFGLSQPASDTPKSTIKFLCSYGGKILPRYPDGKLRYLGGHTRVLSVDRTIQFSELLSKLEELCGSSVTHLRCQLPAEDLDALVSITSDEDLINLTEEYDRTASSQLPLKIRAFISPPRSSNKVSKPPLPTLPKSASVSSSSSVSSTSSSSSYCSLTGGGSSRKYAAEPPVAYRCVHHMSSPTANHVNIERSSRRNIPLHGNCNRWQ